MQTIALPKNITFSPGEQPNQKLVTIEPLYPGYGTTIGNALRRVLLSSLPGTAVVGVKIKGADHEFMALPNIKEDVLDIALNLKLLALKIHTDEIVKLELEVRGEKEVTAADIKTNSDVEVANKDLVLAHVTDPAGTLEMEIYVSRGMGYETIENREDRNKEIGYIEIDSIFSPVLAIGVSIENTRVGKMTNWDKLVLNITTDGTITPEEAFEQSTKVLINQFNALIDNTDDNVDKIENKEETESKEEKDNQEETDNQEEKDNQEIDETKVEVNEDDLLKLTRDELNKLAEEKGIKEPDKLKTKDDVVSAINEVK